MGSSSRRLGLITTGPVLSQRARGHLNHTAGRAIYCLFPLVQLPGDLLAQHVTGEKLPATYATAFLPDRWLDDSYVQRAPLNPKRTHWVFHDDKC